MQYLQGKYRFVPHAWRAGSEGITENMVIDEAYDGTSTGHDRDVSDLWKLPMMDDPSALAGSEPVASIAAMSSEAPGIADMLDQGVVQSSIDLTFATL